MPVLSEGLPRECYEWWQLVRDLGKSSFAQKPLSPAPLLDFNGILGVFGQALTIDNHRTEKVGGDEDVTIDGSRSVKIGHSKSETVGKTKTETVGLAKTLTIGGLFQTTVGAAMNTTVGLSQSEQVFVDKTIHVGEDFHVTIGNEFKLTCGESSLTMKKNGQVVISGKNILIDANGTPLQLLGKDIDLN